MDFMKVFDQTVREIKREVNLKVLKVPEIEQKVLDATDNEPWGPHGSDLAEIAKATKKFSECQLVMNVLWTRLSYTGKDWRHVYKALTVIEYMVANGSERAVDEIIEHSFQISSLSGFEFVEPSGKDLGINVRKKVETIGALLNDKDKIQEVRKKAAANRDKYFGLSSTGVTNKSSSTSFGSSSSSFQKRGLYDDSGDRKLGDSIRDNHKEGDRLGEEKFDTDTYVKSRRGVTSENQGKTKKNSTRYVSKDQDTFASRPSKPSTKIGDSDKYGSVHSQSPSLPLSNEDDFDDFDPRGTFTTKSAAGSSNKVDLFGESLVGDLMDAPSVPVEVSVTNNISTEVDLFADAAFVSATSSNGGAGDDSQTQAQVDLFASQPAFPPASSTTIDFFAAPVPVEQTESKYPKSEPINTNTIDPFASVPINNFDGSDLFGAFTSHTDTVSQGPTQNHDTDGNLNNLNGKPSPIMEAPPKKDSFQVKSGVWADSLSRGLIDLNISAPKKVSLADIGVVGGLSDGSDERDIWGPPTSFNMGRAMGAGSGIGTSGFTSSIATGGNDFISNRSSQQHAMGAGSGLGNSGFNPSTASGGNDFFSNLSGQEYQYGSFKK